MNNEYCLTYFYYMKYEHNAAHVIYDLFENMLMCIDACGLEIIYINGWE